MDELATYWLEYGLVIAGLVVCACLVVGVAALILRRGTAPKPVPAPEHWMGFEQRRFSYPGRSLRVMATVLISVVLVGGVMVGPVALGVASDVSWYVRVDWIIALFVAITVSGGAYYLFLGTDRPRCPSCKSTALEKSSSKYGRGAHRVRRIYLCRSCQIVWQTMYELSPERGEMTSLPRNF